MNLYTFADDNLGDHEWTVEAATEKEARVLAWAALTDEQRDRAASIECVEVVSAWDRDTQAALASDDPLGAILALLDAQEVR
jgi:hypothetical protein